MGNCVSAKSKSSREEYFENKNGQFTPNVKYVETYSIYRPEIVPCTYPTDGTQKQIATEKYFQVTKIAQDKPKSKCQARSGELSSTQDIVKDYIYNYPDLRASLNLVASTIELMAKCSDSGLADNVEQISKVLTSVKRFEELCRDKLENTVIYASFLVDIDGISVIRNIMCQIYNKYSSIVEPCLDKNDKQDYRTEQSFDKDPLGENAGNDTSRSLVFIFKRIFYFLTRITFKLTSSHDALCKTCREKKLLLVLLEISKTLADKMAQGDWQPEEKLENTDVPFLTHLFHSILGIVYNIARRTGRICALTDFTTFFPRLLNWAKIKESYIGIVSLLCLAHQIDEKNNHLIENEKEIFQFLVQALKTALNSTDRKSFGFSASELAEGLTQLGSNESNKRTLGLCGAVETIVQMMDTVTDEQEEVSAARALWVLAFDDQNKKLISTEERARRLLCTLAKSSNRTVRKAAAGVLWETENKRLRDTPILSGGTTARQRDVMISYQRDAQNVIKEVKNRLIAAGYRVYMGIEAEGVTLETMAREVESACSVLVCVSQKYKDSPDCRSEAEYAHQMKKKIIPLSMEQRYQPDGWLETIVDSKLLIDFSQRNQTKGAFERLICVLSGEEQVVELDEIPNVQTPTAPTDTARSKIENISKWKRKDVKKWIKEIETLKLRKKALKKLDGLALVHLQELRNESPDYFYQCLKNDLGLTSVFDVFKFRDELEKLLNS